MNNTEIENHRQQHLDSVASGNKDNAVDVCCYHAPLYLSDFELFVEETLETAECLND